MNRTFEVSPLTKLGVAMVDRYFTIHPDSRPDSDGRPIQGWLVVCQGGKDSISCFFPTFLYISDDYELDHGFQSACLFF